MAVPRQLSSAFIARLSSDALEKKACPIIGIGASAGGITALEQFFAHMPPDSGVACIVILHLAPDHESAAAAVLQLYTSMPVTQVTEAVAVEPNHVYVIPPARLLSLIDGWLQPDMPANERARHTPINQLFYTLAETHGSRAAAIVLSGMGDDGALGMQQIKAHGGVTFAQAPEEAEHDSMPRNVIAAGNVDFVLPVAQIPAKLIACWHMANIASSNGSASPDAAMNQQLEAELQCTREQLRALVVQHEVAVEETKTANEEVQAVNEELRTITEALGARETNLKGVNHELNIVNHELKQKLDEISQINNDLLNLMAATEIGTIFIDRSLRVKRYTPSAQTIFNLTQEDINRPLAHITHKLAYDHMIADAENVLQTQTKIEREVLSQNGCWYLARLLPYHTIEDRIDGVILTFVDITARRHADQQVQLQAQLLNTVEQAVIATNTAGNITYWNRFAEKLYGWTAAEVVGQQIIEIVVPQATQSQADEIMQHLLAGAIWSGEYVVQRRDGTAFPAFVTDAPIHDERGNIIGVVGVSIDISMSKQTQADLHQALAEVHAARDQLQVLSRRLLDVQEAERRMLARELHDEIGQLLTGLSLRLLMIDPHDSAKAIRMHVQEIQRQVSAIMAQVRMMSLDLRPPMLDDLGLLAALEWHLQRYTAQTHIHVAFTHHGLAERRFSPEAEITAYRVIQEALTNVARHAGVTNTTVQVTADAGQLHVQIMDHGRGFDPAHPHYTSSGLSGMRERVQLLQGTITLTSAPGAGTCVAARLPVTDPAPGAEGHGAHADDRADR